MKDTIVLIVGESGSGKSSIVESLAISGYNYIQHLTKDQYKNKGISLCIVNPEDIIKLKESINDAKLIVIYLKADRETRKKRMLENENNLEIQINYDFIMSKIINKFNDEDNQFKVFPCDYVINTDNNINHSFTILEAILNTIK